jgi:chromate transporter
MSWADDGRMGQHPDLVRGARPVPPGAPAPLRVPGVGELFRTYLIVGASAVGMALMQTVRTVPVREGWLSQQEVDEGFGVVQLYPGAILMDLVAFVGYRLRRIRGALAAAAGFLAPSLLLVLGLSWAYFSYGTHPGTQHLVVGLDALVIGVLASVTIDFGAEHIRRPLPMGIAAGAFAVAVAGVNVLWAVLGAFIVGAVALRGTGELAPAPPGGDARRISGRAVALASMPGLIVAGGVAAATLTTGVLGSLTLDMTKIGSVAFGNGTAILPVLQQDAVAHHWVTLSAFGAGVAFGQLTPGPMLTTAAFVGFAAAGWWGGVIVGIAIFAPSVALTMIVGEVYPAFRHLRRVRGAIAGILAGFTGLLASLVVTLGRPLSSIPAALVLAGAAFVAMRLLRWRWSTLAVFAGGLAIWGVYLATAGPV